MLEEGVLPRNPLGLKAWLVLGSRWKASDPRLLWMGRALPRDRPELDVQLLRGTLENLSIPRHRAPATRDPRVDQTGQLSVRDRCLSGRNSMGRS